MADYTEGKDQYTLFSSRIANMLEDVVQVTTNSISGVDILFIPRATDNPTDIDWVLGEMKQKNYKSAYKMKVIAEDPTMIQTNADVFNKFGFQINDEATLWISRREFRSTLTRIPKEQLSTDASREYDVMPHIDDLVYIPMTTSIFQITWTEDNEALTLGHRSYFKLIMKKYKPQISDKFDIISSDGLIDEDDNSLNDKQNMLDVLNRTIDGIKTEEDERELNQDQTGFDPLSTSSINDDLQVKDDDLIPTNEGSDLFGKF